MELLIDHAHHVYEILRQQVEVCESVAHFCHQSDFFILWVYEYFEERGHRDVIWQVQVVPLPLEEVDETFLNHDLSFAVPHKRLPYFFEAPASLV